jgi:hypothetical protein
MGWHTKLDGARWGWGHRAHHVGLALVVVLVTGAGALAGCSTGGGAGLSSACQSTRQKFSAWLDTEVTADTAANHPQDQWTNANPPALTGPALTTAISQYNADLQVAQAARAKAAQAAATVNKAIGGCNQAGLPKACRGEFAQYKPIMDNIASSTQAEAAIGQAIATEQQARTSGDVGAFNTAVGAQNAAVAQHNDLTNTYNVTLRETFSAAVAACNKVASGGAKASTIMSPAHPGPTIATTTTTTTTSTTSPPSPPLTFSTPEGAIAAYLSAHGLVYAGDCSVTSVPADIGKYCSILQKEQGSTSTYLVGPVASEGRTFVVTRYPSDRWRVTSPAS